MRRVIQQPRIAARLQWGRSLMSFPLSSRLAAAWSVVASPPRSTTSPFDPSAQHAPGVSDKLNAASRVLAISNNTATIATGSPDPDPSNDATKRAVQQAEKLIATVDDKLLLQLVAKLSPERRRYLLVAAAAEEWYGKSGAKHQVQRADGDADSNISASEYRAWVTTVFQQRGGLSWREFFFVALHTAIPFVAFGMLDNSVMILSGDLIDRKVGSIINLSAMGAAALGGVVSGTFGIQVHGLAERAVQLLGFQPPPLSAAQRRHPSFFRATHVGGTCGICIGLILGMTPLLFLETATEAEEPTVEALRHQCQKT